jgi:hypothetical protein
MSEDSHPNTPTNLNTTPKEESGEGSDNEPSDTVVAGDHSNETIEELISNYKLVDLKNICRSLNLKVTGNKRPVAERIWNYYHNPQQEEDNSSAGADVSYYQQAQIQQYQLQQQQQLSQLPPQQQQLVIAFNQQVLMLHQNIAMYHSQGQPVPQNLQQMYIQYASISQLPVQQQAQLLTQMQQQQLQQYQMQQSTYAQSSDQQQLNGGNELKRPRDGEDLQPESAKRIKTANNEESQVMKIIQALINERKQLSDNSQLILSMQSIGCNKNHLTQVIQALLSAHMDHIQIVDCVAYVLYEILDKKVMLTFYHNYQARPEELYELRVLIAYFIANFLKACIDEQGDQDYANSDSVVKLFDLMTWISVLDYVTVKKKDLDMTIQQYMNEFAVHQKVVLTERSTGIFYSSPESQQYIKHRFETIDKIVSQDMNEFANESGPTDAMKDFVQLLKDAKPYFDSSALEIISQCASVACGGRSPWNLLIQTIREKNIGALNQLLDSEKLPVDDDSNGEYEFIKQCNNKLDHWWVVKYYPSITSGINTESEKTEQTTSGANADQGESKQDSNKKSDIKSNSSSSSSNGGKDLSSDVQKKSQDIKNE